MPERLQMIANFIEVALLTILNLFFLITWLSVFTVIPLLFSTIYSIGKIKRDIDRYHDGKASTYFKYLIGIAKKN